MSVDQLMKDASDAWNRGDLDGAESALKRVLARQPKNPGALRSMGLVHTHRGDAVRALEVIRRAATVLPRDHGMHLQLAEACEAVGDGEGAVRAYRKARELQPNDPLAMCGEASVLERMHQLDESRALAREAVSRFPESCEANVALARAERRISGAEVSLPIFERALELAEKPNQRAVVLYDLGKALDKLGRYADAFDAYTRANDALGESVGEMAVADDPALALCDEVRRIPAEQFASWRESHEARGPRTAFLFGFPRSGTTMTDRILNSHKDVLVLEEKPNIRAIHLALGRFFDERLPLDELLPRLTPDQIELLRTEYREAVRARLGARDARRWKDGKLLVIDKFPLQLTSIGTISRVMPEAKVMIALRDPRDACLSCFMQAFSLNLSMAQFLDLERTARSYNAVMGMWAEVRDRVALDTLEVRYEDTVSDFEAQARRVLSFLELDWDDALREFNRVRPGTLVSTPSYEAVTRPINRDAIGRWKNYREQLAPLAESVAPLVEAFGYEPA